MAKVKDINLHVVPMYGQVQFFGEGDEYPEWGDEGVAVSSAAATFLGMPDVGTCSVSLHIYDEYEEVADVFYESMIAIGMNGLEVAYVEASSEPGSEGIMGTCYSLPWRGEGALKFVAPDGFVEAAPGFPVPRSVSVHVMPSDA